MIEIKANAQGAEVDITGNMTCGEMLTEALGAVCAIVGAVANAEDELIARSFVKAVIQVLSEEEAVAECIQQGIEAVEE